MATTVYEREFRVGSTLSSTAAAASVHLLLLYFIYNINGVALTFDQCHGNKDNLVAFSFSSCAEFYMYTKYYQLFYIETRIILLHS